MEPAGGSRASRILGGGSAARSTAIAATSTVLFFGLLALVVVRSPGWPEVKEQFFDRDIFTESLRAIARSCS